MTVVAPVLVVDTATKEAIAAIAAPDGELRAVERWTAGYRHGEELLGRVEAALRASDLALADLGGIVVGTGPGAFTGLRVGIATAKGLAHAARLPIAGVGTGEALLAAAAERAGPGPLALLLPAGPSDRVLCRPGEVPQLLPGGTDPDPRPGERVLALDLEDRASDEMLRLGAAARDGLPAALARLGIRQLASGGDDLARLVPEYVSLPRGVREGAPDDAVQVARAG